jgi:Fe-S cluster assembly protein SufD
MEVMEGKDVYLSTFARLEKNGHANGSSRLRHLRGAAIDRFAAVGFPSLRDEEWRFTNIAPLARIPFEPAERPTALPRELSREDIRQLAFGAGQGTMLIFLNGRYLHELSTLGSLPEGAVAGSLAQVLAQTPGQAEPHLAHQARLEDNPFIALNTAFLDDGAFISIPRGQVVTEPIHLVFVSAAPDRPTVSHPRNLVVLGVNSQATIVETYLGPHEDIYFTNAVTEVVLGENAVLDHYKVQRESKNAFHIATMQVSQRRSSNLTNHAVTLGGGLVRNDVNVVLDAEGCECTLNGLYLADGRQHVDNHTRIDHARSHCASHELYKGILDGKAHGVFNGKIYVHQDAQKTDAKQTNKTLLLSDDAVIDTKPQLEIFADDVKCTHGATIGQLAEEAIFYLRARGIGRDEARSLLTFAFANDIIGRIKVEPIRAGLEQILLAAHRLPGGRALLEAS